MTWPQLYDPFGNRLLSTAVAALPVLTLFFVLVALKKRVWVSALCGLLVAVGARPRRCSGCRRCWWRRPRGTASSSA